MSGQKVPCHYSGISGRVPVHPGFEIVGKECKYAKGKLLTSGFCSSANIKVDHAAMKELQEATRKWEKQTQAKKRNKKSWLVMFEASQISDSFFSRHCFPRYIFYMQAVCI